MSKPRFGTKNWHQRKYELDISPVDVDETVVVAPVYVDLEKRPEFAPPIYVNNDYPGGVQVTSPADPEDNPFTGFALSEPFYKTGLDSLVYYHQLPNPQEYTVDDGGTPTGKLFTYSGVASYDGYFDYLINSNNSALFNSFSAVYQADGSSYSLIGVGNQFELGVGTFENLESTPTTIPWSEGCWFAVELTNIDYVNKTVDWAVYSTASAIPTTALASGTLNLYSDDPYDCYSFYTNVAGNFDVATSDLTETMSTQPSVVIDGLTPTPPDTTVDRELEIGEDDHLKICKVTGLSEPAEFEGLGVIKPNDHVYVNDSGVIVGVMMTPNEVEATALAATPQSIPPINFIGRHVGGPTDGTFTELTLAVSDTALGNYGVYTSGVILGEAPLAIHFKGAWSVGDTDSWQAFTGFGNVEDTAFAMVDFKDYNSGVGEDARIDLHLGTTTKTIQPAGGAKPSDEDEFALICTTTTLELYKNGSSIGSHSVTSPVEGLGRVIAVVGGMPAQPSLQMLRNPTYPIPGTFNVFAGGEAP